MSGIGAAVRLKQQVPGMTFMILEQRDTIGGTWDQFRYPGVRSDSDMFTLGYSFRPWRGGASFGDGASILDYIRSTATEFNVHQHIRFSSRVVAADFDTASARWTLTVRDAHSDLTHRTTCRFLYACAGYYDYENPHDPAIPGVTDFTGELIHPQFWPAAADLAGRRVAVIGSGATAATLVPALLTGEDAAAHVTMVQRTPTWMTALPVADPMVAAAHRFLPRRTAHRVIRTKNILLNSAFYEFCQRLPGPARSLLARSAVRHLGDADLVARHFTPEYRPWDQRLCVVPGGDLFHAVASGRAEVVTGHIERFVQDGIRMADGETVSADVVVTATGLRVRAIGGLHPSVDGTTVNLAEQFVWNGAMITRLPNFAMCLGYTNASWTLRADLTHRLVCRVLNWMDAAALPAVVPQPAPGLRRLPLLGLSSGYILRALSELPSQGHRAPWRVRQNYLVDRFTTLRADPSRSLVPVRPHVGSEELSPTR